MNKVADYLTRTEIELGEWKEELGDNFPSFLNHVLIARLIKAEDHLDFLNKMIEVVTK